MLITAGYFFVHAENNIEMFQIVSVLAQVIALADIVFIWSYFFMNRAFYYLIDQQ